MVAAAHGKTESLDKVSVIARGAGVGHLAMLAEEKSVLTRADMESQIAIAMAGIAAEELVLSQPSTGAEQDLERATTTARDVAGRYGMSTRLGPVRVLAQQKEVFLGRDYLSARDVSPPTLEQLDAEVRHIVEEQKGIARAMLDANRKVLDALAAELVSQETIQGPELAGALADIRPKAQTIPKTSAKPRAPRPARAKAAAAENSARGRKAGPPMTGWPTPAEGRGWN